MLASGTNLISQVLSPSPVSSGSARHVLLAARQANGNGPAFATTPPSSLMAAGMKMSNLTLLADFVEPYIKAHTLSLPTARYAYLLSIIVVGTLLLWSIATHCISGGGGVVAAAFRKISIWRLSIRLGKRSNGRVRKYYSPTMGQLFAIYVLAGIAVTLSIVGDNYIAPSSCTFWGICEAPAVLMTTSAGPVNHLLVSPNIDISANGWTTSARLGLIAYALLPLCVSLALKQWPFNVWATPVLTNYSFDKTAILHRWSGRVIWAFSTAHTVAWIVQLYHDVDPYSRPLFLDVWLWWRFIAGAVAYGTLTLLTLLSFSPLRSRFYELFYWSHIVLVIVFLFGCTLHAGSRILWPIGALAIWGLERLVRFGFLFYDNRIGTLSKSKPVATTHELLFDMEKPAEIHPAPPRYNSRDQYSTPLNPRNSYYAFGPGQLRTHSPYLTPPALRPHYTPPRPSSSPLPSPGYALAQLLPGRTIRLTIHAPGALRWMPGQHMLLTIPGVALLQSHPYTISNVDQRLIGNDPHTGGSEIVMIIRAQKGFSLKLWREVVIQRAGDAGVIDTGRGVEMRAIVSRPMGSTARTDFDSFETVLIVVGGTGISFGMSILEYISGRLAASRGMGEREGLKTTRVRMVWIVREFAHLSWVAPALRRCLEMLDPSQLQVDIFVSQGLPPPRPIAPIVPNHSGSNTHHQNRQALPRLSSDASDTSYSSPDDSEDSGAEMTLFDGESLDRTESEVRVSSKVREEGKLRRAISRRSQGQPPSSTDDEPFPTASRPRPKTMYRSSPSTRTPILPSHSVVEIADNDDRLDLTPSDTDDLSVLAELAKTGRPAFSLILDEEIERSRGRVIVACCGPHELNNQVRNMVAKRIDLGAIRRGDQRGDVQLVVEDFSY